MFIEKQPRSKVSNSNTIPLDKIPAFRDKFSFLSNMYECKVGMYRNAEAAFQAQKCKNSSDKLQFVTLNGLAAKKLGRTVNLKSDWDDIKLHVMERILKSKFSSKDLMDKLCNIKGEIIERNYWKDTYWGVCNNSGKNHLGKILMKIRDEELNNRKDIINVINKFTNPDHIYCGRGTPVGNPYSHKPSKYKDIIVVGTRDEACDLYEEWFNKNKHSAIIQQFLRMCENELEHKGYVNLGCFCAPKRCHCETIKKELINRRNKMQNRKNNLTYAGIGSRETPDNILNLMSRIGIKLEKLGYTLHSGGADGADRAFAQDVTNKIEFIPWKGFNKCYSGVIAISPEAMLMASKLHPVWDRLSQGAKKLMTRNCHQILGVDLNSPVDFVICWTPDGAEQTTSSKTGGTGQAIRLANRKGIPVFNLANKSTLDRLKEYLHIDLNSIENNSEYIKQSELRSIDEGSNW